MKKVAILDLDHWRPCGCLWITIDKDSYEKIFENNEPVDIDDIPHTSVDISSRDEYEKFDPDNAWVIDSWFGSNYQKGDITKFSFSAIKKYNDGDDEEDDED